MSYRKTGKIDLHKALKTVAVCGLVGIGVAAGKVAMNEPWHSERVPDAPGQKVAVPSTTKGDIASGVALLALVGAGVIAFKGKENDLGRDAKIVDGVVQKNGGNKKDAPINIADLKKAQQGR